MEREEFLLEERNKEVEFIAVRAEKLRQLTMNLRQLEQ